MNVTLYLCIFLPLLLIFLNERRQNYQLTIQRIKRRKISKGATAMFELIQGFLGKECLLYTMNSQITGTVREVKDGWVQLETASGIEAVNLDYVMRVREYPRDKKGRKKSIVCD